jgi:hypothetical protein
VDYAPRKRMCDVLLVGSAHAPGGRPVERMTVGLRVGPMSKSFDVVGDRVWNAGLTGIRPSAPKPFVQMPVSYDVAFGGADREPEDPGEHDAYLPNPAGRGWRKHLRNDWVDGKPLPNTEESGAAVTWPRGKYRPMALGPVGRGWPQRAQFAGTYDQKWLDDVFPFLPEDFDERYYQTAPADQQLEFPKTPLEVVLSGFTDDGVRRFELPFLEAPVHVFPKRGEREDLVAPLDTVVFEPDTSRITTTWRATRPLRRNMHEITQVVVGRKGKEWWQQRDRIAFPIPVVMVPVDKESVEQT